MNNVKTGTLIKELRKEKNMTQKELADLLHITDRAVSKWERGLCAPDIALLEPLAKSLDVSILELIEGVRTVQVEHTKELVESAKAVLDYSKDEIAKKTRTVKIRAFIACGIVCAVVLITILSGWHPVIFQRGNPVPYLIAAAKITDTEPYVQVFDDGPYDIFISRRGECPALFDYIEEKRNVTFVEQMGGAYMFATDTDKLVVTAEVYFAKYTVWEIPNITLSSG